MGDYLVEPRCLLSFGDGSCTTPGAPGDGEYNPVPDMEPGDGGSRRLDGHVALPGCDRPGCRRKLSGGSSELTDAEEREKNCLTMSLPLYNPEPYTFYEHSWFFMVWVVPVEISIGIYGHFGVDLEAGLCFAERAATASIIPEVGISGVVGGYVSLAIAKAGLEVELTVMSTRLIPSASLQLHDLSIDVARS